MRPSFLLAATSFALAALVAAGPMRASSVADFSLRLESGESDNVASGTVAGVNPGHFAGTDETYPCGDSGDPTAYCQTILVEVHNTYDEADAKSGRERASLDLQLVMDGVGDLALLVYESDADGVRGTQAASSDGLGETTEATAVSVTTSEGDETRWYLVEVFFHAFSGSWDLSASFA